MPNRPVPEQRNGPDHCSRCEHWIALLHSERLHALRHPARPRSFREMLGPVDARLEFVEIRDVHSMVDMHCFVDMSAEPVDGDYVIVTDGVLLERRRFFASAPLPVGVYVLGVSRGLFWPDSFAA